MKIPGFSRYGNDELFIVTTACVATGVSVNVLADWLDAPLLQLIIAPAAVVWLIALWFFRDPNRNTPDAPDLLISPADGVVQDIAIVDNDAFPGGKAKRFGIFMSPVNVHVNRVPTDGEIVFSEYRQGAFLPAYNPDAPTKNEMHVIRIRPDDSPETLIEIRQITGVLARRIVCPAKPGEKYKRGERYGMIKFGSRVEVWVAVNSPYEWQCAVGQPVIAGETLIAKKPASGASAPTETNETQQEG
jgi:phosphatidylserine decarboxylase